MLSLIFGAILHFALDVSAALSLVASIGGASVPTLHRIYTHYRDTGEIFTANAAGRGADTPRTTSTLTLDAICTIHRTIVSLNRTKGECRLRDIHLSLRTENSICLSASALQRALRSMGYCYGRSKSVGTMSYEARKARCATFMRQYAVAIEDERAGRAVIVYMDESYVCAHHRRKWTWFAPASEQKNEVAASSEGDRQILMHAMTRDGLLGATTNELDLTAPRSTAEHFFVGGMVGDDYHKNMNDELFLLWVQNRFIPAFIAKYGRGAKCILLLDNASYHHARGDEFVQTRGANKLQLAETCERLGIVSVNGTRNGQVVAFPAHSFTRKKSDTAPSSAEIIAAIDAHVVLHPELRQTKVQRMFDDLHWQLIYTPPYTPAVQPIEYVWAFAKQYIASQYGRTQTMDRLRHVTIEAFYGSPDGAHPGITPELCQRMIRNTRQWCDEFIALNMQDVENLAELAALHDVEVQPADIDVDINDEFADEAEDAVDNDDAQ